MNINPDVSFYHLVREHPSGDVIGVISYEGCHPYSGTFAPGVRTDIITKSEYETYVAFGFKTLTDKDIQKLISDRMQEEGIKY